MDILSCFVVRVFHSERQEVYAVISMEQETDNYMAQMETVRLKLIIFFRSHSFGTDLVDASDTKNMINHVIDLDLNQTKSSIFYILWSKRTCKDSTHIKLT